MAEKKSQKKSEKREIRKAPRKEEKAKPVSDVASQKPRRVTAMYKDAPTSPQKGRIVADMVRGKKVQEAIPILQYTRKKAAKLILKTLKSAVANAENNLDMNKDELTISRIVVDDGIKFRRYRFVSRGRAHGYVRRRARILVELSE